MGFPSCISFKAEFDSFEQANKLGLNSQVSHHPPMVGQYCEATSGKWKAWQEFSMRSKFKGKRTIIFISYE